MAHPRRSAKSRLAALETDSLAMATRTESEDGGYGGRSWDKADLPILASISIQGRSHPLLLPTGNNCPRGSWSLWLQQACCGLEASLRNAAAQQLRSLGRQLHGRACLCLCLTHSTCFAWRRAVRGPRYYLSTDAHLIHLSSARLRFARKHRGSNFPNARPTGRICLGTGSWRDIGRNLRWTTDKL